MDKIFKAMADINRRKILTLLKNEEMNVGQIVEKLEIGQSTVSSHLAVLRKANLVEYSVKAKTRIYKLKKEIMQNFAEQLSNFCNFTKDEIIFRRKTN